MILSWPAPLIVMATLLSGGWAQAADNQHHATPGPPAQASAAPGRVAVPVACTVDARREFNLGMAHQHSFGHAAALLHFRAALAADPCCGMAQWGMALATLDNLFQTPQAASVARAAAQLQGATARNARDTGWINAPSPLVQDGPLVWHERLPAFVAAMRRVAEASPRDNEPRIFLGLALIMAAPADDPQARMLRSAAGILDRAWKREPRHPGAIHYLIHALDTPPLAGQGMAAARRYAEVAPDSTHAQHMPSHIFTRIGAWDRSITSNQRAARLATEAGLVNYALHAQDYLVYAMLQIGHGAAASRIWAEAQRSVPRLDAAHLGEPARARSRIAGRGAAPARPRPCGSGRIRPRSGGGTRPFPFAVRHRHHGRSRPAGPLSPVVANGERRR